MYILNCIRPDFCYSFTNMLRYAACFLLLNLISNGFAFWVKEINCPKQCTCSVEHLTETAIYRFIKKENLNQNAGETFSSENNEVMYEDTLDNELLDSPTVRSAICIIENDTDPTSILDQLPKNTESISFIQGYKSDNKSIKFSAFDDFKNLLTLEIIGTKQSDFFVEIDVSLSELKYLNLENVLIKKSKNQLQKFVKKLNDEELTFEYVVQKHEANSHPITIVQKGTNEEVLPFNKFKEQEKIDDVPLFIGFQNLLLLRISNCEVKNVHWEMFDGLQMLEYLILERNDLHFIPAFAFYGTPSLKSLSLAHNRLLDIQITDLAGLLELEYLDLSYNNFSQLSELTLPPFPNLKLANFANNPISIIYANTFEVMNTTDSLIIGSDDMPLTLITNSFYGLNLLKKLTLNHLNQTLLRRDLFTGLPSLQELILTGIIKEIEYDAFAEVYNINKLYLSHCNIMNISMDAFFGLEKLHYLDLSNNKLEYLPPGIFDQLTNIKEIYLNSNKFKQLPRDIFSMVHPKLLRLTDNPWRCSCDMSEWKPVVINKIKQKILKQCDNTNDKGIACASENRFTIKYVFDTKVAPKCAEPKQFLNWNVFHAMRRILKCPDYKPKFKKVLRNKSAENSLESSKMDKLNGKLMKHSIELNQTQGMFNARELKLQKSKFMHLRKYKNFNRNIDNSL